jgi:hypothetical protein
MTGRKPGQNGHAARSKAAKYGELILGKHDFQDFVNNLDDKNSF